jgi:hypothetical protein
MISGPRFLMNYSAIYPIRLGCPIPSQGIPNCDDHWDDHLEGLAIHLSDRVKLFKEIFPDQICVMGSHP